MTPERRTWVARIGAAFALWLVVCVIAYLLGNHPRPGLIALLVAACAGTLWLFLDATVQMEAPQWAFPASQWIHSPGEDARLSLLARLIGQHLDAKEVGEHLQRHLMEIADQRLVAHHGVSRRADPERAATLIGPELADFATWSHPYPRLTLNQIDVLISRIEDL
jgi:hypothetical protein